MRRHQPLTVRQVEVLQWVADGCPAGVWRDFTYKTTAYALAARGLLSVVRRRHQWSATLTDDGRFYLQHGRYPSAPDPAGHPPTSETGSAADDFAAHLLAQLTQGAGQIIVRSPSDRERASYRRAIHLLITGHRLPEGFVLRHTRRDHGDLTIRLTPRAADPRPAPPQVSVPPSTAAVSPEVRALASRVRLAVTEPTRERAARILQAIAEQCAARGWSLGTKTST